MHQLSTSIPTPNGSSQRDMKIVMPSFSFYTSLPPIELSITKSPPLRSSYKRLAVSLPKTRLPTYASRKCILQTVYRKKEVP